ncbi:MAG TPA: hypothetical protein VKS78_09500 [Roseiarcus sp.]|nr:hypothetical protein [Roseiarcus sp.]
MSRLAAPAKIGLQAYASWRATSLGVVTEALELRLILDLVGELQWRGCFDLADVSSSANSGAGAFGP